MFSKKLFQNPRAIKIICTQIRIPKNLKNHPKAKFYSFVLAKRRGHFMNQIFRHLGVKNQKCFGNDAEKKDSYRK